jgi:hypothetical protein
MLEIILTLLLTYCHTNMIITNNNVSASKYGINVSAIKLKQVPQAKTQK